jgi:hypothetical protein
MENNPFNYIWSASSYSTSTLTSFAWAAGLANGFMASNSKDSAIQVVCVR